MGKTQRKIRSGAEYDSLIPRAALTEKTLKRGAFVEDTVKSIPEVIRKVRWQAAKVAPLLQGENDYETSRNVWEWVKNHIKYHKDTEGIEELRSFRRSWHDRFRGVDCDCMSIMVLCLISHLNIKKAILRITKYKNKNNDGKRFTHIYPIVPLSKGKYITMDCVIHSFDYEEPYYEKQDSTMELQFLDGIDDELFGDDDLGKKPKAERKAERKAKKEARHEGQPKRKLGGKILNAVNKANPATVLLRNGILAAMKLNIMKIAGMLKWSYLREDQVRQHQEIDITKWQHLVKVREKLEKIFYGAGGKPENFKKAILKGKGNKHNEVSGLAGMDESTTLEQLLGTDIYHSENIEGLEGLGELGVVGTAAALASATGVLATIKGLLKKVGSIFPAKSKHAEDFKEDAGVETDNEQAAQNGEGTGKKRKKLNLFKKKNKKGDTGDESPALLPGMINKAKNMLSPGENDAAETTTDEAADTENNSGETESSGEDAEGSDETPLDNTAGGSAATGFWLKNKNWLKPTLIGIGGLVVLFAGFKFIGAQQNAPATPTALPAPAPALPAPQPMAGLKSRKKKKIKKKVAIALM